MHFWTPAAQPLLCRAPLGAHQHSYCVQHCSSNLPVRDMSNGALEPHGGCPVTQEPSPHASHSFFSLVTVVHFQESSACITSSNPPNES